MAVYKLTPFSYAGTSIAAYNPYWSLSDPNPANAGEQHTPVDAVIPIRGNQPIRSQPGATTWLMTINLPTTQTADLEALMELFDPTKGLQYLRCTDGDGVTWRVEVELLGAPRMVTPVQWKIPFYVPSPIWELNTATNVLNTNQTVTPFTLLHTPDGNRDTIDIQNTISADTVKSLGLNDYAYSIGGLIVNRAPNPLTNEPVYLFDQSGAAARLLTSGAAGGAVVQRTTSSTTVTVNIAAGATTITVASTAAFSASGGMGWISDSRGAPFHDQFTYTGFSGLVLQGVVWLPAAANGREPGAAVQTGGGVAHTIAQVSNIRASGLMLSADDLDVWLDGTKMAARDVTPVAWNTSASDVLITVTMPKRKAKTIVTAMTAVAPANGGSVQFAEGVADLSSKGEFVIDNEIFAYNGKDVLARTVTDVRRAMFGSSAAVHAVNATADFSIRTYVVAAGKASAAVQDRPLAYRPCIDVPASSNLVQRWGNESSDPNTALFDARYPSRPKAWSPGFDSDGNDVSPLMSISESRTALTFKDDVPGDGLPARNYAEMFLPQGIDAGNATAIIADWTPFAEILNLEMLSRDANGTLKLIDQLQQAAAAAARSPAAFANIQYALKLKGRYNAVTGEHTSGVAVTVIDNVVMGSTASDGIVAVQFKLDQDTLVSHVIARLACTGAGSQDVVAYIMADNGGTTIVEGDTGLISAFGSAAVNSTSILPYKFTAARPYLLQAGTYWLMLSRTTGAVVTVNWHNNGNHAASARNYRAGKRAGTWTMTAGTMDFKICSAYDVENEAPIQNEMPVKTMAGLRTGIVASFDRPIVTLEPSQTVYVHRFGAFGSTMMHFTTSVERTNPAGGNKVTVDRWGWVPSSVTIDHKLRVCTYTENGYSEQFGPVLRDGDYISLDANTSNTLTFTEPDLAQTDYSTDIRSRASF